MSYTLSAYLEAMTKALVGSDKALIQDALYDAQQRIDREMSRLAWEDPLLTPSQALEKTLAALGTPEQLAETYRQREQVVAEALATPRPPTQEAAQGDRPWPSFFGVFSDPKAYTSVLYLLLSLPVGIFAFTWVVTGLSLSLGLMILVIGFPLLIFFLGSSRALALAEGRLVEALLDVRMPRRPTVLPAGLRWTERLGNLFKDGYTWTSLVYLLLHMPFGIFYFTAMVTSFSLSVAFMAAPLMRLFGNHVDGDFTILCSQYGPGNLPPMYLLLGLGFLGVLGLVGTLHLALALGRAQGWLARQLLVKR
ncbi:MAG: sensor domain-containing protein [Holophaga sp.]|nr:sensor domain-containing protein [Holophaga sp.]